MKYFFLLILPFLLVSCTVTREIDRPVGNEYIIAGGGATTVRKSCPEFNAVLSADVSSARKERRISCP